MSIMEYIKLKLLDMMINSIYTNPEIFLRELISNASDAIDKLYYKSLTDTKIKIKKEDLEIRLIPDKEKRTLTIKDNGIGMDKEELEENLGTIAKSGSELFKENNEMKKDISIIKYDKYDDSTIDVKMDVNRISVYNKNGNKIYLILDKLFDKRIYEIKDIKYINLNGLNGKYTIYYKIDGRVYKTDYFIEV